MDISTREMLDIDAARELLVAAVTPPAGPPETVAITAAHGRVTANAVIAPMNVPPFTASAMDGYAVASGDDVFGHDPPFVVAVNGVSRAGHPMQQALAPNRAARVFTGAPMPARSDSVVLQENVTASDGRIRFDERPRPGRWVRPAGHDVHEGAPLIAMGRRLNAFDLAALASAGIAEVAVWPRLRVAVFSTGDELASPHTTLAPGQIFESNRLVIAQLLAPLPITVTDLGILPDDESAIASMFAQAVHEHDAIITSGGVSVGDADFVRSAWTRVGSLDFWRLALRPGKPLAYGRAGHCHFFGLPGNPVSTVVTLLLVVRPMLEALAGSTPTPPVRIDAVAAVRIDHEPGRAEYQRGRLDQTNRGLEVRPTGDQSSNRIASFSDANCLIELDKENPGVLAGARVQVLPFKGLLS